MADESRVQGVKVERGEFSAWINTDISVDGSRYTTTDMVEIGLRGRALLGMAAEEAAALALELTRIVGNLDKARTEGRGIA